jgi:hypothetical protein
MSTSTSTEVPFRRTEVPLREVPFSPYWWARRDAPTGGVGWFDHSVKSTRRLADGTTEPFVYSDYLYVVRIDAVTSQDSPAVNFDWFHVAVCLDDGMEPKTMRFDDEFGERFSPAIEWGRAFHEWRKKSACFLPGCDGALVAANGELAYWSCSAHLDEWGCCCAFDSGSEQEMFDINATCVNQKECCPPVFP